MKLIDISATLNFAAQRAALMWAKDNLQDHEYYEIKKSYNLLFKWSIIFVICCIPVMVAFMSLVFNAPFSKRAEVNATPPGATGYVMARADYDGNFYWTHNSSKYEYALKDYGLSPENFDFGDKIKVYVNDEQKVIKVSVDENISNIRNIEVGVGVIGSILFPLLLILFMYIPIAYRTFGKRWIEFYRNFDGISSNI